MATTSTQYDYFFKLLLVGDVGVGKSVLLARFANETYAEPYIPTINLDLKFRTIKLYNKTTKLQMCELACQWHSDTTKSSCYQDAQGIIVVYDITNQESFNNVEQWLQEIERRARKGVGKLLVGNKVDLFKKRAVGAEAAKNYAEKLGIGFAETSAKVGTNVKQALLAIVSEVKAHTGASPMNTLPGSLKNDLIDFLEQLHSLNSKYKNKKMLQDKRVRAVKRSSTEDEARLKFALKEDREMNDIMREMERLTELIEKLDGVDPKQKE